MLQHTAAYCNTLQHSVTHCDTLQHTVTHCNTLQYIVVHCNTLQHAATHCNTMQHNATQCNTMQHNATQCNTLQHTATHCIATCRIPWLKFWKVSSIVILHNKSSSKFIFEKLYQTPATCGGTRWKFWKFSPTVNYIVNLWKTDFWEIVIHSRSFVALGGNSQSRFYSPFTYQFWQWADFLRNC